MKRKEKCEFGCAGPVVGYDIEGCAMCQECSDQLNAEAQAEREASRPKARYLQLVSTKGPGGNE